MSEGSVGSEGLVGMWEAYRGCLVDLFVGKKTVEHIKFRCMRFSPIV